MRSKVMFFVRIRGPPRSPLFPYATLFRSWDRGSGLPSVIPAMLNLSLGGAYAFTTDVGGYLDLYTPRTTRSEEHTSELQSRQYIVCRLLLEKKTTAPPMSRLTG